MIDLNAEAKRYISIDEVIQALIDDDPETRILGDDESNNEPRSDFEGQALAQYTLMSCGFHELRPVVMWHPMADLAFVTQDTSDDLVTASISVMLNGDPHGYPLGEVFEFMNDRVVRWRRTDVARQLRLRGVRVPAAVMPVHLAPAPVHRIPPAEVKTTKGRLHPLDGVIALACRHAVNDDWPTVWAVLCTIAEADDRPAPLIGFLPEEGIKYRSETAPWVAIYSRETFARRWRRKRTDTDGH